MLDMLRVDRSSKSFEGGKVDKDAGDLELAEAVRVALPLVGLGVDQTGEGREVLAHLALGALGLEHEQVERLERVLELGVRHVLVHARELAERRSRADRGLLRLLVVVLELVGALALALARDDLVALVLARRELLVVVVVAAEPAAE